jgi:hypothetical protein
MGVVMPVLIAIAAALGAAAFWYYRLRAFGQVAHEAVDGAQRLRGAYRRNRFRKQVESSPFLAVQDPATAAAVMLVALATVRGRLTPTVEDAIRAELAAIVEPDACEETFTFGCWLAGQANDPNDVSLRFSKLWTGTLTHDERLQFYAMASRIAGIDGGADETQRHTLARLKDRLCLFRV